MSRNTYTFFNKTRHKFKHFFYIIIVRKVIFISFNRKVYNFITCFFKFRRYNIINFWNINSKRNKCRRYCKVHKCSRHTIFTTNSCCSHTHLSLECTYKSSKRFTPFWWICSKFFKIFLECKSYTFIIATCCNNFCKRFNYSIYCTMERTPFWYFRIISITHNCCSICISCKHRNFCNHSFWRSKLIFSSIWHKNCISTYCWVKSFNKSFLTCNIKFFKIFNPCCFYIITNKYFFNWCIFKISTFYRHFYIYICYLCCTVSVKEISWYIYYIFSSPFHNKSSVISYNSNRCSLKVFFICKFYKFINIFFFNYNCHSFLWFWNSKFCSVKTFIFFRNSIKIYNKTVCKLTNSNRNTTSTKVITTFNHFAYFWVSVKSLKFSFSRCITFLNFCSTSFNRLYCMLFWWTSSTTTTVTTCSSTNKYYNIIFCWNFSYYIFFFSSSNNSTYFHSFCNKSRVINFCNLSCCKTDLISIWAVSFSSFCNNFSLWKFSCNSFWYRNGRVSSTCYTHSLIYICTSWKWVTNSSTKTGCSTTKRFNFCWVIVSFVFEHYKPLFSYSININRNNYWASINFFWLVKIIKNTFFTKCFHTKNSNIHKINISCFCFFSVNIFSFFKIFIICFFECIFIKTIFKRYIIYFSLESCMATVVRPICVYNSYFCYSRISFFCISKIFLAEYKVFITHSCFKFIS